MMMEIGRELVGVLDPDAALERALAAIFRIFPQAERGLVLSRDSASPTPCWSGPAGLRHPDAGAGPSPAGRSTSTSRSAAGPPLRASQPTPVSSRAAASRRPGSAA